MGKEVIIKSPAKINIHLDVKGRRDDGYHDLISLFQMISIQDEIRLRSLKDFDVCVIEGDFDFPANQNTMYKAVELFRYATGIRTGVLITCTKRIPEGSGLGGGSSNAAAVLRALDVLFETGLTAQSLRFLGERIGSDVPFFCSGPAALVKGRGELIRRIKPRIDFTGLAVFPEFRVSTKEAYQWLDESARTIPSDVAVSESQVIRMYQCIEPAAWIFTNSFTRVLEQRFPVYKELFMLFKDLGADFSLISGSGSSFYGIFCDREAALEAERIVKKDYPSAAVFAPLDKIPTVIVQ